MAIKINSQNKLTEKVGIASLDIKEMQFKTPVKFHLIPEEKAIIDNSKNMNTSEFEIFILLVWMQMSAITMDTNVETFQQNKTRNSIRPMYTYSEFILERVKDTMLQVDAVYICLQQHNLKVKSWKCPMYPIADE